MSMDWLESLLYGLFSGLSEFLPISMGAHQQIMRNILGAASSPLLDLMINIALLLSMVTSCWTMLSRLRRELRKSSPRRRSKYMVADTKNVLDIRLLKTAAIPMVAGMLILYFICPHDISLPVTALFLVVNGLILYIPEHMRQGNKDSRQMSRLDSFLIGLGGALSALPGLSRIGICTSAAVSRGADKQQALNWALLLSLPGILVMIGGNILDLVAVGVGTLTFITFVFYLLSMAAAFIGSYMCVILMRFLTVRAGYSVFAYYSWGAALFAFILYLI